jgi:hypothetical protein
MTTVVGLTGCFQSDAPRIEYRCGSLSDDGTMFTTVEEARTSGLDLCEGVFAENLVLTDTEKRAMVVAYGSDSRLGLAELYGICAQRTPTILADHPTPMGKDQAAEILGAMLLCPDHPDRAVLEGAASRA